MEIFKNTERRAQDKLDLYLYNTVKKYISLAVFYRLVFNKCTLCMCHIIHSSPKNDLSLFSHPHVIQNP